MAVTVFDPNLFQFNVFQIGNPATTGDVSVTLGNVTCFGVTASLMGYLSDVTAVAYGDTFQETTVTVTLDDVTCSAAETTRTRAITTRRTRNWQITKRAA